MQKAMQRVKALGILLSLVGVALPGGALAEQTRAATKPAVDHAPVVAKHVRHHAKKQARDSSAHAHKDANAARAHAR